MAEGNIIVKVDLNRKQVVKELQTMRDDHTQKAHEIDKMLAGFCTLYGHDDHDDGHDSHYSYTKCACCGRMEKE